MGGRQWEDKNRNEKLRREKPKSQSRVVVHYLPSVAVIDCVKCGYSGIRSFVRTQRRRTRWKKKKNNRLRW